MTPCLVSLEWALMCLACPSDSPCMCMTPACGEPEQVIDEVEDYLKLLRGIYDFKALGELLRRPDFKIVFDGMHGVAGPYAKRILVQARSLWSDHHATACAAPACVLPDWHKFRQLLCTGNQGPVQPSRPAWQASCLLHNS